MPVVYVALGDSTIYGLGASSPSTHYVAHLFARLQWEYPAARLSNLGTCLATAADVPAQQVPDAILPGAHLVTLSVGPNDLRQGRSPDDFARRVEVILERLDRETDAAVIINALPDMAERPALSAAGTLDGGGANPPLQPHAAPQCRMGRCAVGSGGGADSRTDASRRYAGVGR